MSLKPSGKGVILIVDDNSTNLAVLSNLLDEAGFAVRVAWDGESAISSVKYEPPDLILLDVMMPGIDGFETCKQLQEIPSLKDIPIIFITALSDPKDKVKALSLGGVDYITKPFQQEEVLARIGVHLKLRSVTQTLEQTLKELQQTQTQLIQTAKMSSLGQVVAGVAHEINNPVSFIYGNLTPIEEHFQNLLELIYLYQKTYPDATPEIEAATKNSDLDFLVGDLQDILGSMKKGTERIRQIVLSLRNFSRLEEAEMKAVDIHEGIDNTLLILQHRLRGEREQGAIKVIKEYGQLPEVTCYASQLNQVFINILNNAIDALEEVRSWGDKSLKKPTIKICTSLIESGFVKIRIADNGCGMSEDVLQKIFDPFFTQKSVGKGIGLGLSISHSIVVDRHGGRLSCVSGLAQGTEFEVEIPIAQTPRTNPQSANSMPLFEKRSIS